jgi:hypothetical protein
MPQARSHVNYRGALVTAAQIFSARIAAPVERGHHVFRKELDVAIACRPPAVVRGIPPDGERDPVGIGVADLRRALVGCRQAQVPAAVTDGRILGCRRASPPLKLDLLAVLPVIHIRS